MNLKELTKSYIEAWRTHSVAESNYLLISGEVDSNINMPSVAIIEQYKAIGFIDLGLEYERRKQALSDALTELNNIKRYLVDVLKYINHNPYIMALNSDEKYIITPFQIAGGYDIKFEKYDG
ncbi:hypothetical protein [Mucilaginibacter sp.]|jgi:hypothetical protein|uniref:hypothetical protein n=1 Tax=Mucilaginibacter sp. TaxID=1882438 RepID=UPI0035664BC7